MEITNLTDFVSFEVEAVTLSNFGTEATVVDEDDEADFFTVYGRDHDGFAVALIDCCTRADAENAAALLNQAVVFATMIAEQTKLADETIKEIIAEEVAERLADDKSETEDDDEDDLSGDEGMDLMEALGVVIEAASIRREQWRDIAAGENPQDAVSELWEADEAEAEKLADLIDDAIERVMEHRNDLDTDYDAPPRPHDPQPDTPDLSETEEG